MGHEDMILYGIFVYHRLFSHMLLIRGNGFPSWEFKEWTQGKPNDNFILIQ